MKRLLILLAVLICLSPTGVRADGGELTIRADSMAALPDGTLEAEGNVTLEGRGFTARADRILYDAENATVTLKGSVEMTDDAGGFFTGESLELNLDTMVGDVTGGEIFIEESGIRVRGERITRLGPDEYEVSHGEFTSCTGECPDWSFTASRLRVHRKGYVTARHASFRIAGIPVFYSPYLFYPVKTDRQSGLLIPELNYTERSGLETTLPLFLTLGDAADVTFTLRTFSRDETGLEGEFRYDLPWGGGGTWSGFSIGDRAGRGQDRWYYSATHAMVILEGVWTRGRWYDAGNPDAPTDFGESFQERNPGVVDRHLFIEGDWDHTAWWAGTADLIPDGSDAGSGPTIDRIEAGAQLGWFVMGPLDLRATLEYADFGEGGDRYLLEPELALHLKGPGPLSGRLWGEWTGSDDRGGTLEDSFAMLALEERISLAKQTAWGLHRLDLSLTGIRSTSFRFNESVPRDGRDNGQKHEMVTGRLRSRLESSSYSWEFVAAGWSDWGRDEAMGFGSTLFRRDPWHVEATVNRDAEFGLVLPLPANADPRWEGWSAGAGYTSDEADLQVNWESSKETPDILSGSYRIPYRAFEFSGRAQFDLDADRASDERHTITYLAQCWELGLSRIRNLDRTDWKLNFNLTQKK